jgi:Tle cognate immunity protein 4 C-terminal domain/Tle cognate immunity protein 4 N-terminal domain
MSARIASLLACSILVIAACGQKPPRLTEQEKRSVTGLTTDLQARCVGRYLIDMPGKMLTAGLAKIQDVIFEAKPMSWEEYDRSMTHREFTLKATKSVMGYRFLYDYGEVRGIKETRYFTSLGNNFESSDAKRLIEAYRWDRGYRIKLHVEGTDFTASKFKDLPVIENDPIKTDVPQKTRLVFDLLERVQGRPDDVIPDEPGVCFTGGFLPQKAGNREEVQSYFAFDDKPDVFLSLESYSDLSADTTLLQRITGSTVKDTIAGAGGHMIRSGPVALGTMKAEEILMAGKTQPNVAGHVFSLEANATTSDSLNPYLLLDMSNGSSSFLVEGYEVKQPSLTEGEALALWDAVSRTLRPRPNGF